MNKVTYNKLSIISLIIMLLIILGIGLIVILNFFLKEQTQTQPMVTRWNISAGDSVAIGLYTPYPLEDYEGTSLLLPNNTNITIDWGDGSPARTISMTNLYYNEFGHGFIEHTYNISNESTIITITGQCNRIDMSYNDKLVSIDDWGYTRKLRIFF